MAHKSLKQSVQGVEFDVAWVSELNMKNVTILACFNFFQEIQNKDLMYLHDFEKKPHFENNFNQTFFWFLTSTFFLYANVLIRWFFLQRARAWALLVFVIILLLRVWLRFFSKKSHDIPSCYKDSFFLTFCKFPKSKKTKKISNK